jgi:membrane protein YdbS with pleckstrin-like domain
VAAYDLTENPISEQIRLSRRKIIKKTLVGNVVLIIIAVLLLLFYPALISINSQSIFPSLARDNTIILVVTLMIIFMILVANVVYHYLYYKKYYYNLRKDILVIRKGVFTPKEISVPLDKIQDVYVDRDMMDLLLGLYDVHVSSATIQSGAEAHIDGVKHEAASQLREMILEKMQKVKTRRTIGG